MTLNSYKPNKDHILIIAKNPVGGIRTYFRYVYSHPSLSKFDKTLMLPFDNDQAIYGSTFQKIKLSYSETTNKSSLYWFQVIKELITKRPAIVHSHGLKTGVFLAPILRLLCIKHVVTLHDVFDDYDFRGKAGTIKHAIISLAFKLTNVINPCGKDVTANLQLFFPNINSSKIFTIQNGININEFNTDTRRDLKLELNVNNGTLLLGFFGRFMNQKGFDLLRSAILELSKTNIKLQVACFGWGGFIREEQEELEKQNISSLFHFLPHTDKVGEAMRGLDAVVIPSRWEACPLLPMEALVAGLPVVSSNCIGLKDVTENTPAIAFKSGSVAALVQSLDFFVNNIEQVKVDTADFRSAAIERFDVAGTSCELHKLYTVVLKPT